MIRYLGTLLLAALLASFAAADDTGLQQRHWLLGVAFRYEGLRATIQDDLAAADAKAAMAKELMNRAQAAQNAAAQDLAHRTLAMAEKTKAISLEQSRRVEAALQQVRELLALPGARLAKINSFATGLRGEVKIRRAGSDQWVNADGAGLQTLAAGDVISVGKEGQLELHLHNETGLDSRLKLAADTTLRVQASEPGQDESLELFVEKGSLHWREQTTGPAGEAVKQKRAGCLEMFLNCLPKRSYHYCLRFLQACSSERWRLRGSGTCSFRGTEFLLIEDGRGTSECVVLDGSVIYHSPKLGKVVVVEKGQSVTMNPEGEFSPVKRLDVKEWKGWWNE